MSRFDRPALCSDHKFQNGVADSDAETTSPSPPALRTWSGRAIFMCARIGAAVHKAMQAR